MGLLTRIIQHQFKKGIDFILKLLPIYWKSINKMPVWYWFEIQKGSLKSLYKFKKFKYVPSFFFTIVQNMLYEFDNLDLTILRKKKDIAILKSLAARTGDKGYKFDADILNEEIEQEEKALKDIRTMTINDFTDYIELTFNQIGSIDPFKMSTAKAFSLFHKAKEKTEKLNELYKKN